MNAITVGKNIVVNFKINTSLKWVKLTAAHVQYVYLQSTQAFVSKDTDSRGTQRQNIYRDTAPAL